MYKIQYRRKGNKAWEDLRNWARKIIYFPTRKMAATYIKRVKVDSKRIVKTIAKRGY